MVKPYCAIYQAEPSDQLVFERLELMTLIYQRRSGMTHIVTEPVPEMLIAMGEDAVDAATLLARLGDRFDLSETDEAEAVIFARLEELAELGLVERVNLRAS